GRARAPRSSPRSAPPPPGGHSLFTDEEIREFQRLAKEHTGADLSTAEAQDVATGYSAFCDCPRSPLPRIVVVAYLLNATRIATMRIRGRGGPLHIVDMPTDAAHPHSSSRKPPRGIFP